MIYSKKYIKKKFENIILKINILEIKKNFLKKIEIFEKKNIIKNNNEKSVIFKNIIQVVDSLEYSIKNCQNNNLKEGLIITLKIIYNIFKKNQISNIKSLKNSIYNPSFHEAIVRVKSDSKKNLIYSVLQKGYFYLKKILRPSIVCITY
ncbi:nucleotide exchange factor GrpE [Candidatus Vidania fulgoroideorum]